MSGFVDLHCHCVPNIDDGVRSTEEALQLLRALRTAGFERVVATPHMRPGLFDNSAASIRDAFERLRPALEGLNDVPEVSLSSEHYFDDVVFGRLLEGTCLPYAGGRAALLEFYDVEFMPSVAARFFDLRRRRIVPVIAHPERYRGLWKNHDRLTSLVDAGAAALLDLGALVGKYGAEPERCAKKLLKEGLYHAACSDAHRPSDVSDVVKGIRFIEKKYGSDEVDLLLHQGPLEILTGSVER